MIKTKVKMSCGLFDDTKANYGKSRFRVAGPMMAGGTAGLNDWAEPGDRKFFTAEERAAVQAQKDRRKLDKLSRGIFASAEQIAQMQPRLIKRTGN